MKVDVREINFGCSTEAKVWWGNNPDTAPDFKNFDRDEARALAAAIRKTGMADAHRMRVSNGTDVLGNRYSVYIFTPKTGYATSLILRVHDARIALAEAESAARRHGITVRK